MENKNEKVSKNKFKFVSIDDDKLVDDKKESDRETLNDDDKTTEVVIDNVNDKIEKDEFINSNSNTNLKRKMYISFEARVLMMSGICLVLFIFACFLILEALNYGKDSIVSYSELGSSSYNVCLKENDFYSDECLDEGMQYVSGMINNIKTSFNYTVDFSTDIDYSLNYHVVATTKIFDKDDTNKVLYQAENVLIDKTPVDRQSKKIEINSFADIDYVKYNQVVNEYKSVYGLDATASVDVSLILDEPTESRSVASVNVPLGEQTFGITKSAVSNANKTVKITNDTWNYYNSICAFFATFFIVISLMILYRTTRLVLKVANNKSKYQAKIDQLLRDHDRLIVIARNGYESMEEKKVIKVTTFDELLAARETLNKPIIFSKVNDVKCEFIVEDTDTLYKYILKEADL